MTTGYQWVLARTTEALIVETSQDNPFILPWPPKPLWPNRSKGQHWASISRVKNRYSIDCYNSLRSHPMWRALNGKTKFTITFRPPDRRRRDLDNMLAAIKTGIDVLARNFARVDDSQFSYEIERGEPVEHGCVEVRVRHG